MPRPRGAAAPAFGITLPRVNKPWFLESVAADGSRVVHPIDRLPFRVGREAGNELAVDARGLSRRHAEFRLGTDGALVVHDLDSTNGTWVNRERIKGERVLAENDVLHFGNAEYRLGLETATRMATRAFEDEGRTMMVPTGAKLTENFVQHEREFRELLAGQGLTCAAQPIVAARDGALRAYELLGRCEHPALREPPGRLFDLARKLKLEAPLSAAFRRHGITRIAPVLAGARVFVNTHPDETFTPGFLDELRTLRALPGQPAIVVEVHETAVVQVAQMRRLANELTLMGVEFAYDDFGAGESRLNELGEVPPHFVKFDMGLIRGIDSAPESKRRMLRAQVKLVLDLGCTPLAEGVETEAEAAVCRDMGFELIQGFLTGRPVMLETLLAPR